MNGSIRGRKNWTVSLTLALVLAVIAAAVGSMTESGDSEADRRYFPSNAGPILFDHGKHLELAGECSSCHHDLLSSEHTVACSKCHDDGMESADFEHDELREIHGGKCVSCHEQNRGDDTAVSCRQCHLQKAGGEVGFVGCSSCHDDDYTRDMMPHDEYVDVGDHSCDGCHVAQSIAEIYHARCTRCHLQSSPERFADTEGKTVCGACHLQ